MISKNYKFEKKWRKRKVKEYSKRIYVKFKPEEVEILHNRMKEAGVQNMSAYIIYQKDGIERICDYS